jgi:hypothetical protein
MLHDVAWCGGCCSLFAYALMELRARWPLLSDCCEVFKCQLCAAACNDVQYMLLQLLQTP